MGNNIKPKRSDYGKGKLGDYAYKLAMKKHRVLEEIEKIESEGYVVPNMYKEQAMSTTPTRISRNTYLNQPNLDMRRIRADKRLTTDKIYYPRQIGADQSFTPDKPITLSLHGTPTQMTKQLEKLIRQAKPSTQLSQALIDLADEEGFDVDNTAHATTYDINKYFRITKTLPVDLIKELASYANVDPETTEASEQDSRHRTYISNIKNRRRQNDGTYDVSPLSDLDDDTILKLESVMNSSSAWRLAGSYDEGLESEQVQENWTRIYKAADDANKLNDDDDILNNLLNAIENDDYDEANKIVNDRINQAISRTFKTRKRG